MSLDPRLLAVLACPEDKGPLYYLGDDGGLYNPRLHRRYEVRDGIPVMLIDELSRTGQTLSVTRKPFERYAASGEINTHVDDPQQVLERVAAAYAPFPIDRIDGLTVDCGPWWFNLRPSNTEPLLRLNLEARDRDECDQHVAELLALITA